MVEFIFLDPVAKEKSPFSVNCKIYTLFHRRHWNLNPISAKLSLDM